MPPAIAKENNLMNIIELKNLLEQNSDKRIIFHLPDHRTIPVHFHVTEVGLVRKDFIDCGGTRRSSSACVLQAWVANDEDHVLTAGKLASILKLAAKILPFDDQSVEIEFETTFISQFPIVSGEVVDQTVVFQLETKHTDCLAKEKCGIESESSCCSTESGCCS
jgi:hypothetical protein